ncbi:MAG: hypothetical protein OXC83_03905 [Chloroflexi bacterium]|nr:hypothetical protein [Chloroflexota bacterium]
MTERFSQRHGYGDTAKDIVVRLDAPQELREAVIAIGYETCKDDPKWMRGVVCRALRKLPNPGNWSTDAIREEIYDELGYCEWYEVYDIIEAIEKEARGGMPQDQPTKFATELNRYFVNHGIGWQLRDGEIYARGDDATEFTRQSLDETLRDKGLDTSRTEFREAIRSLSVRPIADVTGAIQHAMAALECLAREVAGNPKLTLGEIIKKNPKMIPPPLDESVLKAWGYSSERGRHLREGRTPDYAEAALVVSISNSVCMYLSDKLK